MTILDSGLLFWGHPVLMVNPAGVIDVFSLYTRWSCGLDLLL